MNKLIISFLWICELVLKPNHNDLMLPKLSKSRVRLYPSNDIANISIHCTFWKGISSLLLR